mmetsp:Transcript_28054/g.61530  ORF Transcript_28054/g.61530 Transcript_28054/m.61530 type:complete len:266 (+) Transcript_28054:335-1132(+)
MDHIRQHVHDAQGVRDVAPAPARRLPPNGVLGPGECHQHAQGGQEHLHHNDPVLKRLAVIGVKVEPWSKEGDDQTLPECQENHRLEACKLEEGPVWLQQLLTSHIEQEHPEQSQRVADIVDDGDVEVPRVERPVTNLVLSAFEQNQGDQCQDRLGDHKLQCALFAVAQEEPVHRNGLHAACAQNPRGFDDFAFALHHHSARATDVGHAEAHEVVDHPGLVAVSWCLKPHRPVTVRESQVRRSAITRNNEDNPDDVALKRGLCVVS